MKEKLLGKNLDELSAVAKEAGLPAFAAKQMARWLYVRKADSFDMMTDISKAGRAYLEEHYQVGRTKYVEKSVSSDGTVKYLFPTDVEGKYIETVMIPDCDDDGEMSRATICVSSQVGCRMNCSFCMTGRGGFHGQLDEAMILSQFMEIDESDELTNAVFMGMGEPLDNWDTVSRVLEVLTQGWGYGWSPKRITLSTIGVLPKLKPFLEQSRCHLAVSLHDPYPDERESLMPVQRAYDIRDVISLIKQYDFTGQRRVSFEYTMFAGINDDAAHADALARLLKGLECRVNLIRFHQIPDSPLKTSSPQMIAAFKARLNRMGITTTLRASRGEDVMAACGLLAGKGLKITRR